jgi:hypothetical protein
MDGLARDEVAEPFGNGGGRESGENGADRASFLLVGRRPSLGVSLLPTQV